MLTITASSSASHRNKGTGLCQQGSCPSQPGVSLCCTLTQTPIFLREESDYCRTDADLQFHCKPEELISFRGGVRKQGSNTYMSIDHQLPFFFLILLIQKLHCHKRHPKHLKWQESYYRISQKGEDTNMNSLLLNFSLCPLQDTTDEN